MSKVNKARLKETYIKNLRNLLEGKVEQAEIVISAKGFGKELQEMIEKVGRLMNEDLGPVVDQIRLTYGQEVAEPFLGSVRGELENVLSTLRGAKETIDDAMISISQGQAPNVGTDMDSAEINGDEMDMGGDMDMGGELDMGGEMGSEMDMGAPEDEFGGEETEEPLGRATIESKELDLQNRIVEMRKMLQKARALQEKKLLKK